MLSIGPHVAARDRQPELMDAPDLERSRHVAALRALARINRLSGVAGRLWLEVADAAAGVPGSVSVLDVACGGGDVLVGLGRRARRRGIEVELVGCDTSPVALEHAGERAAAAGLHVDLVRRDVVRDGLPGVHDVIGCSLFLHHLDDGDAVGLLRAMAAACRRRLVVQDLRRTGLGYLLAWAGTRLLGRSEVARVDGPRSVRGAFTLGEARDLADRAGLRGATVRRCWPQRFLLTWSAP